MTLPTWLDAADRRRQGDPMRFARLAALGP
jgi:hypothetical protein